MSSTAIGARRTIWPETRVITVAQVAFENRECPHSACHGGLIAEWPSAIERGEWKCISCGRVEAYIAIPFTPTRLPVSDDKPRIGRPPKGMPERTVWSMQTKPCPDCELVAIPQAAHRCEDCVITHRARIGITRRLIVALSDGQPIHRDTLCTMLGTTPDTLRQTVMGARKAGYDIVNVSFTYRLVQP
jgi:hypothetical protein